MKTTANSKTGTKTPKGRKAKKKAARVVTVKGTNKGNTKAAADKTTKAVGRPDEYTPAIGKLIVEYFEQGMRAEAIALQITDKMLASNPDFEICAASVRKYGTREHGIAWPKGRPPQNGATVAAASKGSSSAPRTPKGKPAAKPASRPGRATKPPRTSTARVRKAPAQDTPAPAAQDATAQA